MQKGLVQRAQAAAPMPEEQSMDPSMQPGMQPGMASEDGEPNTTPEEDQAHEAAMGMVSELLYTNEESNAVIMKMLKADNAAASASEVSVFLLSKVEETFQGNYPETLVLPTADEISDMVLEIAEESGTFEVTEEIAIKTKSLMVQQLVQDYGVDEQSFKEATQDVTQDDIAEYETMFGGTNA